MTSTTPWRDAHVDTPAISRGEGSVVDSNVPAMAGALPREDSTDRIVALLLDHRAVSSIAIERAARMSDALDAKLHVVLAIPDKTSTCQPRLVVRHASYLLGARSLRHGFELEVVRGSIEERGFEVAHDEAAELVVVHPRIGGGAACRLADRLGVPVLVARDSRPDGEWIAASDMQRLRFPVLAAARDLAESLDREVVYFHNATPAPIFLVEPMTGATSYAAMQQMQNDAVAAKRARLENLAAPDRRAHSLVTRTGSTIDTLLDFARDRDADMLVLGHRPHSWLARLFHRGTTERLVERSRRSVLVVPLGERV